MSYEGTKEEVDLAQFPNAKKLVDRCEDFFGEVLNLLAHPDIFVHR